MTENGQQHHSWRTGSWTTPPAAAVEDGPDLLVTVVEGSDAWRRTSHGFVHDDAHALLVPPDGAVEVTFDADSAPWSPSADDALH